MSYPSSANHGHQNGYGYGASPNPAPRQNSTLSGDGIGLAIDNMLRNELKVADPRDAHQVAAALLARYKDSPRARGIAQEAQGIPYLQQQQVQVMPPSLPTSSDIEFRQANSDVEKSLQDLGTSALLDDYGPELGGWAQAIRSAIAEGGQAARNGLDPRQRDKTLTIRRQLGDYARLARFVGALTPSMTPNYRKLAQALDEVSAVLLVMLGEALANIGFSSGYYLLQVPFSELQQRRDSAVFGLRNLVGATQQAHGGNEWPRGVNAYRFLFNTLEEQGQGDLRALLVESELARAMDDLIQRAGQGGSDGLRALGVTAAIDLERFRRLVVVASTLRKKGIEYQSPPLSAFLESLLLFVDAFTPAGGSRLLKIARPPILFYGLYNQTLGDESFDTTLVELIQLRGQVATQVDYLLYGYEPNRAAIQIMLDMMVYLVDRIIDLYAVSVDSEGMPEQRAIAYLLLITQIAAQIDPRIDAAKHGAMAGNYATYMDHMGLVLTQVASNQSRIVAGLTTKHVAVISAFEEPNITKFFRRFARVARKALLKFEASAVVAKAEVSVSGSPSTTTYAEDTPDSLYPWDINYALLRQSLPPAVEQELLIQLGVEERWLNLVRTMSPDFQPDNRIFQRLQDTVRFVLLQMHRVGDTSMLDGEGDLITASLPPQYETSLEQIRSAMRS
jgi:hypothetical protein